MKFLTLLFAALFGFVLASAEESSPAWIGTEDFSLSQETIGKIRVRAISNALVDLKLQEIGLQRAEKPDVQKLALIRAQQLGLQREIVRIAITTLEDDERRLSEKYLPEHPRMKAIHAEIELRKKELRTME